MRIKGRIITSISLLLIIIVIMTVYSIPQVHLILQKHYYSFEMVFRFNNLSTITYRMLDTSRLVNKMVIHAGDTDKLHDIIHDAFHINQNIRFLIDDIMLSIRYDSQISTRELILYTNLVNELDNQIRQYMSELVTPIYQIALNDFDNKTLLFEMLELELELFSIIQTTLRELMVSARMGMIDSRVEIILIVNNTMAIILLLGILGVIIGIIVAVFICVTVTKAVKDKRQ